MTTQQVQLKNGVRVLLMHSTHTQTVSVGVFVNVGSANETPEENGISHFLEHMAFKGTKRRSYNKISSDAERLGADMNAFTDLDMTAYYIKGLASHAPVFVDILGDIFCNSVFDEGEIEKERDVILQEYKMYADKPNYVAQSLSQELAYKGQAFGRSIIGEPKTIKSWVQQDFKNYMQKHYGGNNVIVGVAGNFDEEQVLAAITKSFGSFVRSDSTGFKRDTPTFIGGSAVKKKKVEQAAVSIMYETVSACDPSVYAFELAAIALGGGMSSPLFDEVREKRGLAYSIGAGHDARQSCGSLQMYAGATADQIENLFTAVDQVLQASSEKIRPIDLERAKNSLCLDLATSTERPFSQLVSTVNDLFTFGRILDVNEEIEKIRSVSSANVKKAVNKILAAKKSVAVVGNGVDQGVVKSFVK